MRKTLFWLPLACALFGLLGPLGARTWDYRLIMGPLAWLLIGLVLDLLLVIGVYGARGVAALWRKATNSHISST